jgi:hypothetical protein
MEKEMKWRAKLENIHKIFQGEVSCTFYIHAHKKTAKGVDSSCNETKTFPITASGSLRAVICHNISDNLLPCQNWFTLQEERQTNAENPENMLDAMDNSGCNGQGYNVSNVRCTTTHNIRWPRFFELDDVHLCIQESVGQQILHVYTRCPFSQNNRC